MIKFIRGDTLPFKAKITLNDGTPIQTQNIKTLLITGRKLTQKTSPIIFQKTLEDVTIDEEGYCHGVIEPEDTEELSYGNYYFDIEVTLHNGYRKSRLYQFRLIDETSMHGGDDNGN